MATFTIPTIYTAVDRFSAPVRSMQRSNASFANSLGVVSARSERLFRSLTPTISAAGKQLLSMASAAAIAGAVIGGATFSAKSIIEYEQAVASFRTIVGGTDKEFAPFQQAINDVARDTKKSSIDTAAAFEKIAGLNAKFAESATSISAVSSAAITLSKASRDELGPSAENLVGIMNQFSLGANQANRTINVLAAGQAVGAASITQTAESFVNFGSVAAGANITLEQSVGLVETLGKFSLFGAEAGTKLRGSVLKLQQAGIGYKSGQFAINDALTEAKKKVDSLRTAKEKDAAVLKIFGAENISTGKILLNNIDLFKQYTASVTNTNEAQKAADINSGTLANRLDELKSAWINMLTGSDAAGSGLNRVKSIVVYVTKNLDKIVDVTITVVKAMALWKAANLTMRAVLIGNNVVAGISTALLKGNVFALRGSTLALNVYSVTSKIATAATWLWNAALSANPIFLVIAGVAALGVGIYALTRAFKSNTTEERIANEVRQRALENSVDLRAESALLFISLRKSAVGSAEFAASLKRIDEIQPGLIAKYNLQAGAIKNIAAAERELMSTIIKRAEVEARSELLKEKTRALIESQNNGPTFLEKAIDAVGVLPAGAQQLGRENEMRKEIDLLANQIYADTQTPVMNPKEAQATANVNAMNGTNSTTKGSIDVNFKNAPEGTTATSNNKSVMPIIKTSFSQ